MDHDEIADLFAALGPVTVRRMFGGKGIYHRGLIVAVEIRDGMLLKADAVTAPDFEAAGATRWTYPGKSGQPVKMPYWSIPEEPSTTPTSWRAGSGWPTRRRRAPRRVGPHDPDGRRVPLPSIAVPRQRGSHAATRSTTSLSMPR